MFDISLLEVVAILFGFCVAYWIITKFARDPYRRWGVIVLAIFAVIYALERFQVINLLRRITI